MRVPLTRLLPTGERVDHPSTRDRAAFPKVGALTDGPISVTKADTLFGPCDAFAVKNLSKSVVAEAKLAGGLGLRVRYGHDARVNNAPAPTNNSFFAPRAAANLSVDPAIRPGRHEVGIQQELPGVESLSYRRGDTQPRVHSTERDKDHFIKDGNPAAKARDPVGGLLPYDFRIEGLANGQGDRKIQAYNYRVCLTTDPTLRIPIEKPAGDHAVDHELLLRNFGPPADRLPALIEPLAGQGAKVDWNNLHAVGSDLPGANWDDPEASDARRREIEPDHETCLRGLLWTLSHSPRVPAAIRQKISA